MIKGLAYVGFGVSNVAAWADAAVKVFGMELAPSFPGRVERLRMDEAAWRIVLEPSAANDLLYAAFEVDGAPAVRRLAGLLAADGVETQSLTPRESADRGVAGGIRCVDPDGLTIELVHGPEAADTAFASALGVNFVTGALGMGHLVVTTTDPGRSLAFYRTLGMRLSDYITLPLGPAPEVTISFLHCNARHHTLALLPYPAAQRLNHLMVEVDSVDQVIQAYYRASRHGLPIVRHLGRHTNDRMLSFYARTPAGFDVEYGCEGVHIGPQWEVRNFAAISTWGHDSQ